MTVSTFKCVFGGVSPLSLYICTGLVLDKVRVRFIKKKKKKKRVRARDRVGEGDVASDMVSALVVPNTVNKACCLTCEVGLLSFYVVDKANV